MTIVIKRIEVMELMDDSLTVHGFILSEVVQKLIQVNRLEYGIKLFLLLQIIGAVEIIRSQRFPDEHVETVGRESFRTVRYSDFHADHHQAIYAKRLWNHGFSGFRCRCSVDILMHEIRDSNYHRERRKQCKNDHVLVLLHLYHQHAGDSFS